MRFTKFYICQHILSDGILILVFCLIVKNNSSGNSSSWKFFFIVFNVVLVLFLAAAFNFSCVFVSLTLASSQFPIFYKTVTLPWENFNLVSLIFSKIVRTSVDCVPSALTPSVFF